MSYIDGFVLAVPTANRQAYIDHATEFAPLFKAFGATRMTENWGDDVPDGKLNDFRRAVQATADETVVFSWIEYPDKPTRDAAVARIMNDPRMADMGANMPFDGQRMIFGGFAAEVDEGKSGGVRYVDGFVAPVAPERKAAYFDMARTSSAVFRDHGALRVVETWGDDLPTGKVTHFARAVHATDGENVVYSWIEWPDKATRDAGWKRVMEDDRMKTPPAEMPFDGKRIIYGGFANILDA